jgi:hypothetical protein
MMELLSLILGFCPAEVDFSAKELRSKMDAVPALDGEGHGQFHRHVDPLGQMDFQMLKVDCEDSVVENDL